MLITVGGQCINWLFPHSQATIKKAWKYITTIPLEPLWCGAKISTYEQGQFYLSWRRRRGGAGRKLASKLTKLVYWKQNAGMKKTVQFQFPEKFNFPLAVFDISKDKSRTFWLTWFFMRTQLLSISSEPFVLVSFSDERHSDVLLRRSWNKKHTLFNILNWKPSTLIIFKFLFSSSTQMSWQYVTTCTDHSLLHSFQFIIHCNCKILCYIICRWQSTV